MPFSGGPELKSKFAAVTTASRRGATQKGLRVRRHRYSSYGRSRKNKALSLWKIRIVDLCS